MRYLRYALGPLRPAPKEGTGWMFAAGELAMTAHDLALWDISMIDQTVLQAGVVSRRCRPRCGSTTASAPLRPRRRRSARRTAAGVISHGGEVSGFTARQRGLSRTTRAAVVVLTNLDATGASSQIASRIANALFASTDARQRRRQTLAQARTIFDGLQQGRIDRSLFTANANAYFSEPALEGFRREPGPARHAAGVRAGRAVAARRHDRSAVPDQVPSRTLRLTTFIMPDGRLEQYQIAAAE